MHGLPVLGLWPSVEKTTSAWIAKASEVFAMTKNKGAIFMQAIGIPKTLPEVARDGRYRRSWIARISGTLLQLQV